MATFIFALLCKNIRAVQMKRINLIPYRRIEE